MAWVAQPCLQQRSGSTTYQKMRTSETPSTRAASISSPNRTPGSHIATRRSRSTNWIFFIPLRSTTTEPPAPGTQPAAPDDDVPTLQREAPASAARRPDLRPDEPDEGAGTPP